MRQVITILTKLCLTLLFVCLAAPQRPSAAVSPRVHNTLVGNNLAFNRGLIEADTGSRGAASLSALADPSDSLWSALGSGTDGAVIALAVYDNKLIAGGNFTMAGGVSANHIAAWDGAGWSPLGSGTDDVVFALTVYNNELIAGGWFDSAGGIAAMEVAAWDGHTWSNLGRGIIGWAVNALTVFDNKLIVGGLFGTYGDTNVAAWDGNSWSALGAGIPDYGDGLNNYGVMSLGVFNNLLIAGGDFGFPDIPVPYHYVASWDGNSWSDMNNYSGAVTALGTFGGKLISGGLYASSWNGCSWSVLDTGLATEVAAYTNFGGRLIAGTWYSSLNGQSLGYVIAWDGTSWRALGSGTNGSVTALAVYDGKLIAGGVFTTAGNKPASDIAQRSPSCCQGMRGNVNCQGGIDLSDLSSLVSYLTGGGFVLCCFDAANVNGVGGVDLGDLTAMVSCLTGGACPSVSCP